MYLPVRRAKYQITRQQAWPQDFSSPPPPSLSSSFFFLYFFSILPSILCATQCANAPRLSISIAWMIPPSAGPLGSGNASILPLIAK